MTPSDAKWGAILVALDRTTDETKGYFALALRQVVVEYGHNGGFTPESRAAMQVILKAVDVFIGPE